MTTGLAAVVTIFTQLPVSVACLVVLVIPVGTFIVLRQIGTQKGIRVELDDRNEKIGYKIRYARQIDRVPYMLILGEKEIAEQTVSVRDRATDETTSCTLDEFLAKLEQEIKDRV